MARGPKTSALVLTGEARDAPRRLVRRRGECWVSLLTRRCLQRGAFGSTDTLEAAIQAYIKQTSATPKPFHRTKPADDILASIKHFYQQTPNSYHHVRKAPPRTPHLSITDITKPITEVHAQGAGPSGWP